MDKKIVLVKTAKGVEEIYSRTYRLPSKLRSILIMINGSATVEAIVAKAAALGGNERSLADLIDQGFVRTGIASPHILPPRTLPPRKLPSKPTRPAPGGATLPLSNPRSRESANLISIHDIKSAVVSMMYDALGPSADDLNRKVEQCKSRDEIVRQVRVCFDVLRDAVDAKKAEVFRDKCQALLG